MALALASNFGSVERWREEFISMGKAQGGGSGWVLLMFQPREDTLLNQWAADHTHALAGGVPIRWLEVCRPRARSQGSHIMKWVTRERPQIDRIACSWLNQRFTLARRRDSRRKECGWSYATCVGLSLPARIAHARLIGLSGFHDKRSATDASASARSPRRIAASVSVHENMSRCA